MKFTNADLDGDGLLTLEEVRTLMTLTLTLTLALALTLTLTRCTPYWP